MSNKTIKKNFGIKQDKIEKFNIPLLITFSILTLVGSYLFFFWDGSKNFNIFNLGAILCLVGLIGLRFLYEINK